MNHRKAGGDDVLKYLNSIESRHRVDAAWHALDDLFQGLCSVDPPGRDMFLAMNLLRPQARKDGKIFRIIPLPKALEDEAHAAVGRMLWEASVKLYAQDPKGTLGLTYILRVLARCFYPKNNERRQARIKNRGKDYETDRVRDQSIAWLVGDLRTSVGAKRAIPEAAALIRRSPKAVKEARKRVAQRLRERRRRHKTF